MFLTVRVFQQSCALFWTGIYTADLVAITQTHNEGTAVIFCFLVRMTLPDGCSCGLTVRMPGWAGIYLSKLLCLHADSGERLNTEDDLVPHEPIVVFFQWDICWRLFNGQPKIFWR